MLYLFATASGESPAFTTYTCSVPTALAGNEVVVPGKVLATGGMVAKFVGVTFTTVVATPKVSPPHDAPAIDTTTTEATVNAPRRRKVIVENCTDLHSRACEHSNWGALVRPTDGQMAR